MSQKVEQCIGLLKFVILMEADRTLQGCRMHGEDLREAMFKVQDIYRKSLLISYQADIGPEIEFESLN